MREPTSIDPEAEERLDRHPCSITAYRGGPYLVRGSFDLLDQEGRRIGLRRRTIALCRCGRTRTGPFCDGSHKRRALSGQSHPAPPAAA